jgi:hypothetical protein
MTCANDDDSIGHNGEPDDESGDILCVEICGSPVFKMLYQLNNH